jgi:hypothetical protein
MCSTSSCALMRVSSANFGSIEHRNRFEEGKQRKLQAQLPLLLLPGVLSRLPATDLFHSSLYLSRVDAEAVKRAGWYRTRSIDIALIREEENTGVLFGE